MAVHKRCSKTTVGIDISNIYYLTLPLHPIKVRSPTHDETGGSKILKYNAERFRKLSAPSGNHKPTSADVTVYKACLVLTERSNRRDFNFGRIWLYMEGSRISCAEMYDSREFIL